MRASIVLLMCIAVGCGGGPEPARDGGSTDAATMDSGSRDSGAGDVCEQAFDCETGEPCTMPVCRPGDPAADARGCIVTALCAEGEDCREGACVPHCDVPDADDDGEPAQTCGGADCDDGDGLRFPSHPTICDVDAHDEDC